MTLSPSPGIWVRPSILLGVEAWLKCGVWGIGQGFLSCCFSFFVPQNFLIPLNTGFLDSTGTEISVSHRWAQS